MKKILLVIAIIVSIVGIYLVYAQSYPNWSVEKKQAYQFMLLKRNLLSHPEKCQAVTVVVQETDWQSDFDTLNPGEVAKLKSYPEVFGVNIILPFKKFGDDCFLSLSRYDGKISARIIRPIIYQEVIGQWSWGAVATVAHKIGTQEYPYSQGKSVEGEIFFQDLPEAEVQALTLEALEEGNKILKNI